MSVSPRLQRILLLLIFAGAASFVAWAALRRAERVRHVTMTDAAEAKIDASSPTGYAGGKRWFIVPEHHTPSYERIAETQQMFASGTCRVRQVDYDNAPQGRPVYSASLYRWWLASLAWIDHAASGRPIGLSVERAAVWSEPLLHLGLLLLGGVLVARWFGRKAAVGFALGVAFLFPIAGSFLPGTLDHRSLARIFAFASVLPLLAAMGRTRVEPAGSRGQGGRRLFAIAGVAGGLGFWIDAPQQTWILAGIGVGAALAAIVAARARSDASRAPTAPLPWRAWSIAGAITSILAYVVEYAPGHLGLRLEVNHPLYAVAWIGLGELLVLVESFAVQRGGFWTARRVVALIAALAVTASLPVALVTLRPQEWFSGDLFASRLTHLPNAPVAANFAAWLRQDGISGAVVATFAPLLLVLPALALLFTRNAELPKRRQMGLALGIIAVALALAMQQLEGWATLDALLLALLAALLADREATQEKVRAKGTWLAPALAALALLLGFVQLLPPRAAGGDFAFTRLEVEALMERAAAHWIADRAGSDGAVILVPPARTIRWCFHGGRLRGLGSAAWENREGLAATIRIVNAQTGEEAQALLSERGVTHLVLPSWDEDLQQFARLALKDPNDAFIMAVHQWALPSWLRPLPYPLPVVAGFEGASIVALQVTDETNRATALARMVEYFLETNRPELADAAGEALARFPADANALVARAQLQKARGQTKAFSESMDSLLAGLEAGFDRGMAWDRRVSLAVVLAQADKKDLAKEQLQRCVERLDPDRILTLTTGGLYRLQVLANAYGISIADPALRQRARELLPEPLRERLPR